MVKIGGGGPKAADTSGVARAHESVMRSHEAGAQQAASMGRTVAGVVQNVQQQGAQEAEQQARKDRLDVEMAKGDLEFVGEGVDRKVVTTEAGAAKAETAEQRAAADTATKATRAAAYELSQRLAVVKAGYADEDGALNPEGVIAVRNLAKGYKKTQALFSRVANGDPRALQEAAGQTPDPLDPAEGFEKFAVDSSGAPLSPASAGTGATDLDPGKAGTDPTHKGGGTLDMARVMPAMRAKLDHEQLKFVVSSGGEMPEDVMMDSKAWQSFNSAYVNQVAILKSGIMMPPSFKNVKERNRFFNEAAAKSVLSGAPAPGSMADPNMTAGVPPAGAPDDGTQPAAQPSSTPGTTSTTETGPGGYGFTTSRPNAQ